MPASSLERRDCGDIDNLGRYPRHGNQLSEVFEDSQVRRLHPGFEFDIFPGKHLVVAGRYASEFVASPLSVVALRNRSLRCRRVSSGTTPPLLPPATARFLSRTVPRIVPPFTPMTISKGRSGGMSRRKPSLRTSCLRGARISRRSPEWWRYIEDVAAATDIYQFECSRSAGRYFGASAIAFTVLTARTLIDDISAFGRPSTAIRPSMSNVGPS